jgi:predicted nucleic acid-binding protein
MTVFVDSSVWYAAADAKEQKNAIAKQFLVERHDRVTTDHILVETWLLLNSRLGHAAADKFWGALRRGVASIEKVTTADLEAAWRIGEAYPDQTFSVIDRTSFAVMERLGITTVASLDRDFANYRFGPGRSRAFSILR